jgi:tRNA1Val (adenine37-N6)-methyltransferase
MSQPFKFKQFSIQQAHNSHKIGTDSMLLGAWVKGNFNSILDIGTGTGILALMLTQKNQSAQVVAIEPHFDSWQEAQSNFLASPFNNKPQAIQAKLQDFNTMQQFDLIITNPPYFQNAYLSEDVDRNRTRHTGELPLEELYVSVKNLLANHGIFACVIPFYEEKNHLVLAEKFGLFPTKILRTLREDETPKRSLLQFAKIQQVPEISTLLVKNGNNQYSTAYVELTKDFYFKDLSQENKS